MSPAPHIPVMLREVLVALAPHDGAVYVDGTFGAGGYSRGLLDAAACTVWGIDRDPDAVARAADLAARYGRRLTVLPGRFGDMDDLLESHGVRRVDGVALDLGVSSMQIDQAERGFSFLRDGPLDMRMEQSGPSAADVVNTSPQGELADIIFRYGEERLARRVASAIVEARSAAPFERTGQLADVVRRVVPRSADGIDPATRTFQALRMYVNDELGELRRGLAAAERLLAPGGRLAVVSFHSLEDREVKAFFKARSGAGPRPSRHAPAAEQVAQPTFRLIHKRTVGPADDEVAANPRARSAKLRAAERTSAAAWASPAGGER